MDRSTILMHDLIEIPIVSQSNAPKNDALLGPSMCGHAPTCAFQDRCGHGPRQPLLVISPHLKQAFSFIFSRSFSSVNVLAHGDNHHNTDHLTTKL